jgi:DNA-binding MarR family transcriptional regulator
MDRTTLTRNLAILEREGLIKISEGKDHRTRNVTATQKGRDAVTRAIPLWNEVQDKVVGSYRVITFSASCNENTLIASGFSNSAKKLAWEESDCIPSF